jgi:hypothetical protein
MVYGFGCSVWDVGSREGWGSSNLVRDLLDVGRAGRHVLHVHLPERGRNVSLLRIEPNMATIEIR